MARTPNKIVADVDLFVWSRPIGVYVASLTQDNVAALGKNEDQAIERFEQLARRLLRVSPLHFGQSQSRTQDEEPSLRILRLTLPAEGHGRLLELDLSLIAIGFPREDGFDIYLPQLSMQLFVQDLKELEVMCAEHLRDRFPLGARLDSLSALTTPITLEQDATEDTDDWMGVRRIRVRFRPEGQEQEVEDAIARPTLTSVGEPLHLRLDRKDAPGAFERKVEVDLLLDYLSERFERSVLLVGPSGVGKTSVVYETIQRIIQEEVPEPLKNTEVWQISGGRLMAGMRFLGQWQERVLSLIDEVREAGAILFAENLVELLETSGNEQHAQGIPGLLLPHILSGEVVLLTEARPEQLAWATQRHPSFVRALRRLPVEPMDAEHTDAVLERVSFRLGRQHGVRLTVDTRQKILELTSRFRGPSALPGPAVDLAERMARTHRKEGVIEEGEPRPLLQPQHAVDAYASQTGMPAALLDPDTSFEVAQVRAFFEGQIFDQPEAVDSMVDLVTVIRAGLNSAHRPLGSFLFLGPTGVGKTQTALTLAEYLFGSQDRLLRFDMSEYQDPWAAGRLVGRYKGEPGELVKRIREQPFQVILLDEIEKADSAVFDLLLQALGEGRLTDALGQTVDLSSAVFVMTSNLGAGGPPSLGFEMVSEDARQRREATHYQRAVEEFFRPEFVGRIDRVIPFRSLGGKTARKLVVRALEQAFSREGLQRREIRVHAEDAVIDFLIEVGFDQRYGARPLRQAVETQITAVLANFIARESDAREFSLVFRMSDGRPVLELG